MTSLHELTEPIYHGTLQSLQKHPQKPLESLQGNILQGHGRDRSVHIFLQFKIGQENKVKDWIRNLAEGITSAQQQLEESERYRWDKTPGCTFMSFFLSAKGYEYLYPEEKGRLPFDDGAFLCGMKAAQHRLNDPPQEDWEKAYQHEIHAMVLLADDDTPHLRQRLRRRADELRTAVEKFAESCLVEFGKVMWNRQNYPQEYPVEHFGFVDGRSQPLFFQRDIERESVERDGTDVWDPGAGPDLVLVPDPYGQEKDGAGNVVYQHSGSYLVFRKLEQYVRAFKEHEWQLAQALGLPEADVKRAGALVMGRFEDGTPIVLKSTPGRSSPVPNNFTYETDPYGRKCPLQAHIRKVNPRQEGVPRIVRRGITYGEREKEPQDNPSLEELPVQGVGLLFMCYQRDIAQQFEILQYLYANDPRGPGKQEAGTDPIIGHPGSNGVGQLKWPARWNDPREQHKRFDFHSFVTLKGGEYFFAPSIYFLRHLQSPLSDQASRDYRTEKKADGVD
jgi:Dyp-type peroxidase family